LSVEGLDAGKFAAWMLDKHRIVVTPINHKEFSGIRVTPNVYTTLDEVDLFADKVMVAIRSGIA
jgi:isopenicillin-N epimerase